MQLVSPYRIEGPKNFLTDFEPLNEDGTVNAVIEIPTGTTAKWEVTKPDGVMEWEFKNGQPRVVKYLGYPGNYGMIPRTLLPKEAGGDGDPLDVIVLGRAVPRGSVVRVRVIGVLKLLDGGEQDDKLVAVLDGDPLSSAHTIADLDRQFAGVSRIVATWFESYKGPGELEAKGFHGPEEAMSTLRTAIAAFNENGAMIGITLNR